MLLKKKTVITMTRLNKYLSECGVASRRKSDELIEQGRVSVNGKIISEFGFQVDEQKDEIRVDGEKIRTERKVYFLLNKPKGTVTTTDDEKGRPTVLQLIRTKEKIFPVGRLDYNTTGLILLTNDGEFANFIMHPSNKIPREYRVKLSRPLSGEDKSRLEKGIILDDRKSKFTSIRIIDLKNSKKVEVKTVEGRNHFVKRMFMSLGYIVSDLTRLSFGTFVLDVANAGEYREISSAEIKNFYAKYKK